MDTLQLFRSFLAIFSTPDAPQPLLATACSAMQPHVQRLYPLQVCALSRLLAERRCAHGDLLASVSRYTQTRQTDFSVRQRKQLAEDLAALNFLPPHLSGMRPRSRPNMSAPVRQERRAQVLRSRSARRRSTFQISDGIAALQQQGTGA